MSLKSVSGFLYFLVRVSQGVAGFGGAKVATASLTDHANTDTVVSSLISWLGLICLGNWIELNCYLFIKTELWCICFFCPVSLVMHISLLLTIFFIAFFARFDILFLFFFFNSLLFFIICQRGIWLAPSLSESVKLTCTTQKRQLYHIWCHVAYFSIFLFRKIT